MGMDILKLVIQHSGIVGLIIGVPFVSLAAAVVVLYKQNQKNQERLIEIIEQKVHADTNLSAALMSLKEVIQAKRS